MGGERARLRWRCRRGMRELDLVLSGWLERRYDAAGPGRQQAFEALLDCPDPQLFGYLTGRETPGDPVTAALVDELRTLQQRPD